ncbi:EamA family transporter [Ramlibacter sp. MAHUQ-53]|uniref:EamA family transporter n=1 Tax=unclassified Ramlibacter TaxID=2617605 RepID=UPI0036290E61
MHGINRQAAGAALALVANAFVWGISWWPFRELQARGLHPLWATAGVYLLSLAVLLAWRPRALREAVGHPSAWVLGAVAGLTNVGFNWGVSIGDVVRVVLLFYLMPAWSIVLAWPLIGEKPTPVAVARLALALAGVVVVLDPAGHGGLPLPASLADWLGLGAGLCFAITNLMLRRMEQVPAPSRVLAMFAGGALLSALTALAGGMLGAVAAPRLGLDGVPLAAVLALAFLLGNVALQYGATRLPAQATALIMLSEVVFASVSSVALGAADLTPGVLAGGALILAAAIWSAWPARAPAAAQSADGPHADDHRP